VPPDEPAELPPETCAKPYEQVPRYKLKTNEAIFMSISPRMRGLAPRIQPAALQTI